MKNRLVLTLMAVLGVCLASAAQQAPTEPSAQLFRYRFEPGVPMKYRVNAQMSGTLPLFGGLPVERVVLDMTVVLKVQKVRPDGNAELGIDVETFKAEMDGQALPSAGRPPAQPASAACCSWLHRRARLWSGKGRVHYLSIYPFRVSRRASCLCWYFNWCFRGNLSPSSRSGATLVR
jgi:hypothetical protein